MKPAESTLYSWTRDRNIRPLLPHPDVADHVAVLLRGDVVSVFAGHGMGKSVLLWQIERALRARPDVRVELFSGPPTQAASVAGCVDRLAQRLGLPRGLELDDVIAGAASALNGHRLVLLFDEVDAYVKGAANYGVAFFNALEAARRTRGFGVLVAGGLGLLHMRQKGSPLISRTKDVGLRPLSLADIELLAAPLAEHVPIDPEVLPTLYALSGGNPALVIYGLRYLLDAGVADESTARAAYDTFLREHWDFVESVQLGVSVLPEDGAARLWRHLATTPGPFFLETLRATTGESHTTVRAQIRLFLHAGLVQWTAESSLTADPLPIAARPSILAPPHALDPRQYAGGQLAADLASTLQDLRLLGLDLYRDAAKVMLVLESTFSAFVAMALSRSGWTVEREAQRGPGDADIVARLPRTGEAAVIEMKLWSNRDRPGIHQQVLGYVASDEHPVTVLIRDRAPEDWPAEFRTECLAGLEVQVTELVAPGVALTRARSGDGPWVDHYLVTIPRR